MMAKIQGARTQTCPSCTLSKQLPHAGVWKQTLSSTVWNGHL